MYPKSDESQQKLLAALKKVTRELQELDDKTILTVEFNQKTGSGKTLSDAIRDVFDKLAYCNPRNNSMSTAAAKILHTIKPDLFVMWDSYIRPGYGALGLGDHYARSFMPRMQSLLRCAIDQSARAEHITQDEAVERLCQCGHTLAKVVDEYNYVKFTWATASDERGAASNKVWNLELAPPC